MCNNYDRSSKLQMHRSTKGEVYRIAPRILKIYYVPCRLVMEP